MIGSAVVFSLHILVIDSAPDVLDGIQLSCIQFFVAGILSMGLALLFEQFTLQQVLAAWVPLLYTGVISSGVGYTLQILGQRTVNPTVASLILSLESVFAALAGWVLLGQPLSLREVAGAFWCLRLWYWPSSPERKQLENREKVLGSPWTFCLLWVTL